MLTACLLLQARAHLHAPGELPLGLHLVNSTNLDYFQPQHQAELFRLKGQFLQALGERDQANSNYSTALTIWDQLPDGWLSWGSHCDEMYESSGNHAWLEYAVSCYLQAVKHGSCAGRTMLPRVIHLLSFENEGGAVGRALDRKLNEVCNHAYQRCNEDGMCDFIKVTICPVDAWLQPCINFAGTDICFCAATADLRLVFLTPISDMLSKDICI